jgi:hypothetical protein
MVLEHHERMDGSWYPNGLTGDNLLLESKILSITDVVIQVTEANVWTEYTVSFSQEVMISNGNSHFLVCVRCNALVGVQRTGFIHILSRAALLITNTSLGTGHPEHFVEYDSKDANDRQHIFYQV